jgi:exodeoxyribonuclease VII large subunit
LARSVSKFCHTQSQTIHWWQQAIAKDLSYRFQQEAKQLQLWSGRLPDLFKVVISRRQEELKQLDKQLSLLHPDQVLKRGYSISLLNGRAVTDAAQLKPEDLLESIFYKGRIVSRVESINNKEEHE